MKGVSQNERGNTLGDVASVVSCFNTKDEAVKVLKAVKALDEHFTTDYVVNIIIGKLTPQIKMYRHEELDVFGIGKEKDEHFWNSLIRQMLLENLIRKDIEEYGLLKFTEKGLKFLKKPASFKIVLNNLFEEANEDDEEGEGGATTGVAADDKLFEMLKDLRHREAKKKGLPPFVVFLESSLQDMQHTVSNIIGVIQTIDQNRCIIL